jgi:condensin complex subunit 2
MGRRLSGGKGLLGTPNLADLENSPMKANLDENNDEAEKKAVRRKSMGKSRRKSFGRPLAPGKSPNKDYLKGLTDMCSNIIKMSSENKISQKNTWELPLIDMMGDYVENSSSDKSSEAVSTVNFQRASCTLDASVKIYSFRVDDTHTSSYKVLENLNRTDNKPERSADDDLSGKTKKEGASKKFCVAETLETNVKNLDMKSVDMDFDVDPLFHKMSQTFDEGGAKGMLLNHLCMYDGCDIAFDSSEQVFGISGPRAEAASATSSPIEETIDTFSFVPKLQALQNSIQKMEMCPPLERLYATRREDRVSSGVTASNDDDDDDDYDDDGDAGMEFAEALDLDNLDAEGSGMAEGSEEACEEEQRLQQSLEGDDDFDGSTEAAGSCASSSRSSHQQPLLEDVMLSGNHLEEASEFSFWNPKLMKGWAGNSHWKFAKPKNLKLAAVEGGQAGPSAGKKAAKSKKVAFTINFTEEAVEETEFATPPRSAASLEQSKAAVTKGINAASGLLLPIDLHYNVACLTQLFSKPHVYLRTRSGGGEASNSSVEGDFTVATNERMLNSDGDFGGADGGYDDGDDGDDGDYGDYGMDGDANGIFGMAQAAHKVEKINIKYETVAKKVDVKKLKSSLWTYLDEKEVGVKKEGSSGGEDEEDEEVEEAKEAKETKEEPKEVSCSQTIADLSSTVPGNVTVPFYFICLLHLANEKGLELTGMDDLSDFTIRDDAAAGEAC